MATTCSLHRNLVYVQHVSVPLSPGMSCMALSVVGGKYRFLVHLKVRESLIELLSRPQPHRLVCTEI